ncbi:MAG: LysR family transcriptional regulator [Proteobacteria bacterium]|nr:LysR family transcriptional regulator [Pseudomonadota bacterium]
MDYRHLHLVAEICRHGSFGRAARALEISQPALSKSIARLEDQLCVKLFARGNGRTQPTIFALHIVARSRQMLGNAEKIAIEVRQMAINEKGRIRIGAEPISRFGFLPSLVESVVENFPQLHLEIVDRPGTEIVQSLLAREIDIGITDLIESSTAAEIVTFPLFKSPVVAVARPFHPVFAKAGSQKPDDYPVVFLSEPSSPPHNPKASSVLGPVDLVREIVTRTDAITRGPAFLFRDEISRGTLKKLPERTSARYACNILATAGALHSPIVTKIVQSAQTIARGIGAKALPRLPLQKREKSR